jgi:hypothetical protein
VADEEHSLCARIRVGEIALGQTTDFVSAGLDPGSRVGAFAKLFELEEGSGGGIDDGVSAERRHGFKVRAFKSQFLRQIPQDVGANTDSAFIVFVMPKVQNGDPADLDEFKSRVTKIDCESIETVTRDAKTVFRKPDR